MGVFCGANNRILSIRSQLKPWFDFTKSKFTFTLAQKEFQNPPNRKCFLFSFSPKKNIFQGPTGNGTNSQTRDSKTGFFLHLNIVSDLLTLSHKIQQKNVARKKTLLLYTDKRKYQILLFC